MHPEASWGPHAPPRVPDAAPASALDSAHLIELPLPELERRAAERPPGYLAAVVGAASVIAGDRLFLTTEAWQQLAGRYGGKPVPSGPGGMAAAQETRDPVEPTLAELLGNFTAAMARWTAAGFAVVAAADFERRWAACGACENRSATLGLFRCRLCGCTSLKLWLATERCPLGFWPRAA